MEELASPPLQIVGGLETPDEDTVSRWLARFEHALRGGDTARLAQLFQEEGHWRDLLAFAWSISPFAGANAIAQRLIARQGHVQARNFKLGEDHSPPRRVRRLGVPVVEAIFSFETAAGRCRGVVRLLASDPGKAWVLMTSLRELKGHEEPILDRRSDGSAYSR